MCECRNNNNLDNLDTFWKYDSCPMVCHENCNCILSNIHKWFCYIFNFKGVCKSCGHPMSTHVKKDYIYEQYEEIEIIDRINALNIMDEYKIVKKDNEDYIIMINNIEESIHNLINHLKNEKKIFENENNQYEKVLLLVKISSLFVSTSSNFLNNYFI